MRYLFIVLMVMPLSVYSQLNWEKVDSAFGPLPKGVHVYYTDQKLDTAPFRAYYLEANLRNRDLNFTTDTSFQRRLIPLEFFEKNGQPLVVMNGTFFSFTTHQNLNVLIRDGKTISYNIDSIKVRRGDTTSMVRVIRGAFGITRRRKADVAWILNDSTNKSVLASQEPEMPKKGNYFSISTSGEKRSWRADGFEPWKVKTAIGGGPVLVQGGRVQISNDFERMFPGKGRYDKHPRTAIGYTANRKLILLVVEGRNPEASGASLEQLAQIMVDLGCVEALNLDGGGSSCLLINGRETIKPSDKKQRAIPGVFLIYQR